MKASLKQFFFLKFFNDGGADDELMGVHCSIFGGCSTARDFSCVCHCVIFFKEFHPCVEVPFLHVNLGASFDAFTEFCGCRFLCGFS